MSRKEAASRGTGERRSRRVRAGRGAYLHLLPHVPDRFVGTLSLAGTVDEVTERVIAGIGEVLQAVVRTHYTTRTTAAMALLARRIFEQWVGDG